MIICPDYDAKCQGQPGAAAALQAWATTFLNVMKQISAVVRSRWICENFGLVQCCGQGQRERPNEYELFIDIFTNCTYSQMRK